MGIAAVKHVEGIRHSADRIGMDISDDDVQVVPEPELGGKDSRKQEKRNPMTPEHGHGWRGLLFSS
ncbi:hypothetical protein D3C85_1669450 [compost metagenome]